MNCRLLGLLRYENIFINKRCGLVDFLNKNDYKTSFLLKKNSHYFQNRKYGIKFYSHPFSNKTTFSHLIFSYIKSFPEYRCESVIPLPNIYDEKSAVEMLQSLIINSLSPEQDDVIRVFSQYAESNRSTLNSLLFRNKELNKLQVKYELSIREMSDNHLFQLAVSLNKLRPLRFSLFNSLSSDVYDECVNRTADVTDSLEGILKYFIITMELYGDAVYRRNGYKKFVEYFKNCVHEANSTQIVQIIHFLGLSKSQMEYSSLLKTSLNFLSPKLRSISFVDTGIVASSVFKLGTKLVRTSSFVLNMSEKLNEKLIEAENKETITLNDLERFSFVSILKNLRYSNYHNADLLKNLIQFIKKLDLSSCDPQFICHSLAIFANSNYYNKELFTLLEYRFLCYIESLEPIVRLKDISRVLWCFSNVNHSCKLAHLNLILSSLHEISKTGDVLLGTKHFLDSILALATYEIFDENLVKVVFHRDFMTALKENNKGRLLSRLLLLRYIYELYFPEHLHSLPEMKGNEEVLPQRTIADECRFRPALKHINNALEWLKRECGTAVFELKFVIPYINYASLVISSSTNDFQPTSEMGLQVFKNLKPLQNCKILIDVNDTHNSVIGGDNVIGLESLKRNLLLKQGWNIKIISEEKINSCRNDVTILASILLETYTNGK